MHLSMPLDQDCTTHLKHVKYSQLRTIAGEKSQNSTETDICQLLWLSNRDISTCLVDMSLLLQILRDWILPTLSNLHSGSLLKFGVPVSKLISSIGLARVQFHKMTSLSLAVRKMVLQVFHHTSLILNRIRLLKQETCQTKTRSIREHSFAKTTRYMHMATRMILHTFMTCRTKHGLKNDLIKQTKMFKLKNG